MVYTREQIVAMSDEEVIKLRDTLSPIIKQKEKNIQIFKIIYWICVIPVCLLANIFGGPMLGFTLGLTGPFLVLAIIVVAITKSEGLAMLVWLGSIIFAIAYYRRYLQEKETLGIACRVATRVKKD